MLTKINRNPRKPTGPWSQPCSPGVTSARHDSVKHLQHRLKEHSAALQHQRYASSLYKLQKPRGRVILQRATELARHVELGTCSGFKLETLLQYRRWTSSCSLNPPHTYTIHSSLFSPQFTSHCYCDTFSKMSCNRNLRLPLRESMKSPSVFPQLQSLFFFST